MEKLVFAHYITDNISYGYDSFVSFEYESKDKFIFDVLETVKELNLQYDEEGYTDYIEFLGFDLHKQNFENIEEEVFTLNEWFEKEKVNLHDTTFGLYALSEKSHLFAKTFLQKALK